jgi:protoporphyrinogen oxidase
MIGAFNKAEREVTVVGAGISGMLAAYALDKKGYRVTLVEEGARGGGLIRTKKTAHGIAEAAAHSLLATPGVISFCEELGVELAEIRKDSRARFIVRGGRPRKFPLSIGETLTAARRAAFARAENHLDEQDLDSWGRRHLGDGAVEYLLSPFVQGIYGVRPADLGVVAAFPELSLAPGSTLLRHVLGKVFKRGPKEGKSSNEDSTENGARPKQRKRMVAPRHGMGDVTGRLEKVLTERLGGRFLRGVSVKEIPEAPTSCYRRPPTCPRVCSRENRPRSSPRSNRLATRPSSP